MYTNVTSYSYYNNSAQNSPVPYITQDGFNTIKAGFKVNYGEGLWAFFNDSAKNATFNVGGW